MKFSSPTSPTSPTSSQPTPLLTNQHPLSFQTRCRQATALAVRKLRAARIVENHSLAWNISSGTSAHVCQSLRIEACKEADVTPSQDTKEKPFHCACGKSFSRNDLLKRHRLREHDTVPQNEDATPSGSSSRTTVPRSPTNVAEPTSNRAKRHEQTDEMPLPLGSMDSATGVTVGATGGQDMYPIPNVFEEFTMFIEDAGLDPSWDRMDLSMSNPTAGQSDRTTARPLQSQVPQTQKI